MVEKDRQKTVELIKVAIEMIDDLISECEFKNNDATAEQLKKRITLVGKDLLTKITSYELSRRNRFIVLFPSEFEIEPWYISSIEMPNKINNKYTDTVVVIKQIISTPTNIDKIMGLFNKKNYILKVNLLNGHNEILCEWAIEIKKLNFCDFGGKLNYVEDTIGEIKLKFETKNCYLL